MVTHPSINGDRRRVTTFSDTNGLPQGQATTYNYQEEPHVAKAVWPAVHLLAIASASRDDGKRDLLAVFATTYCTQ